MISYRLNERIVFRADAPDGVIGLRRPKARVIVVDAQRAIVAADADARALLAEIGPSVTPLGLPQALDAVLRAWAQRPAVYELLATPVGHLTVRAMRLDGGNDWIALLIERTRMREHLEAAVHHFGLSPREVDVLRLLLAGHSTSEIAQRLHIGAYTVGDYIKRLFAKTRVRNRSEMIAKVLGWHHSTAVPEPRACS